MVRKKEAGKSRKIIKILLIILGIIILLVVLAGAYYFYVYSQACTNRDCFSRALVKCQRAQWLKDADSATWLYSIKGKSSGGCRINVELLQAKQGKTEIKEIEKLGMDCYIPLGTLAEPESNLEFCHGLLKEGLQNLMIKKMHAYILENLGQINEEISGIISPL